MNTLYTNFIKTNTSIFSVHKYNVYSKIKFKIYFVFTIWVGAYKVIDLVVNYLTNYPILKLGVFPEKLIEV